MSISINNIYYRRLTSIDWKFFRKNSGDKNLWKFNFDWFLILWQSRARSWFCASQRAAGAGWAAWERAGGICKLIKVSVVPYARTIVKSLSYLTPYWTIFWRTRITRPPYTITPSTRTSWYALYLWIWNLCRATRRLCASTTTRRWIRINLSIIRALITTAQRNRRRLVCFE